MTTDIHASIRAFLQQQEIASLTSRKEEGEIRKAGVIPYIKDNGYRFYVMKPLSSRPDLGEPPFQLCKGTRMYHVPGVGWKDMRSEGLFAGEKETLPATALREGMEELGLKLENIARLLDVGPYGFSSATTGKGKEMWLFAAEMKDKNDFSDGAAVAFTTAARQWVTVPEFAVVGRDDHHYILKDIEEKLIRHLGVSS